MFHLPAHKQTTSLVMLRAALAQPSTPERDALVAEFTAIPVVTIPTVKADFKIPPAGVRVRLGDIVSGRHLFEIEVGGGWKIEVDANTRSQAAAIAKREGYTVCSVNMVG